VALKRVDGFLTLRISPNLSPLFVLNPLQQLTEDNLPAFSDNVRRGGGILQDRNPFERLHSGRFFVYFYLFLPSPDADVHCEYCPDLRDPGDEFRLGRVNEGLSVGYRYGFMRMFMMAYSESPATRNCRCRSMTVSVAKK
jgi:hypothetical protein